MSYRETFLERSWEVPEFTVLEMAPRKRDSCVIVPVINEGERIRGLLTRMDSCGISDIADIVIVDGGSTDGSLALDFLEGAQVNSLLVKTSAGGLSAQLRIAYAFALAREYGSLVTIDGNDKDDPGAIPDFLEALRSGYDFVQASRYVPGGVAVNTPWLRDLAIRRIHAPLLAIASGFAWTDTTQGYRAYTADLLRDPEIALFRGVFSGYELLAYLSYRAPRLGYRCVELPATRRYPQGKAPTKISAFRGNLDLLRVLANTCMGRYNP